MSEYAKVQKRIWNSQTFLSLSEDARYLWLYLLTCPHGNMVGLFVLKSGYVQEDLGWSNQRFTKAFNELLSQKTTNGQLGLVKYDVKTKVLWITNFLEHNPLINPNQVKAAVKRIEGLPYSELFEDVKLFVQSLGRLLYEPLGKGFAKPVTVTVSVSVSKEPIVQDAPAVHEPVIISIPLKDNSDFNITEPILQEFQDAYPDQDVNQTLRDIRIWNISNKGRRKTRNGAMQHISSWLKRNHDKGKNRGITGTMASNLYEDLN